MGVRGVHGNIRCIYSSYPLCAIACLLQGKPFLQFSSFFMAPRDWRWGYFYKRADHFGTEWIHTKTFFKTWILIGEKQLPPPDPPPSFSTPSTSLPPSLQ